MRKNSHNKKELKEDEPQDYGHWRNLRNYNDVGLL